LLESKNRHKNDTRISFDEKEHNYFVDGQKIGFSVTAIIDKFFVEFDSGYWAKRKAMEKLTRDGVVIDEKVLTQAIDEILKKWEEKRRDAAEKGTWLHEKIEDFYNEKYYEEYPIEFSFFKKFHDKYPALTPYRTEWRIFDASVSIAGTVDMVYKKNNGDVFIFDWKRSTKLVDQQGKLLLKDFKYGLDGLSHVEDNSFNRYALQQNIYKYILESNYSVKVSSMNLLVLHPDYKDFIHLSVPEMHKEAKYLIDQAKELSR
tara:strand:+ start:262 stop:1041 length:780 start_codon:yes stop_codon:yes gene_type:complete